MNVDQRIVEIYSPGPRSYGSGFLLGGGLVLTARHVLMPTRAEGAFANAIDVRTAQMARKREAPAIATLAWPSDPAELSCHDIDIALIRLPQDTRFLSRRLALYFAPTAGERNVPFRPKLEVFAIGFPVFAQRADKSRDTRQLTGVVQAGSGLVSSELHIHEVRFNDPAISCRHDWHGFSGAALLASERLHETEDARPELLGVVITRHDESEGFGFKAVRIEQLLEDSAAMALLEPEPDPGSSVEAIEAPTFHKLVCLLDRDEQEDQIVFSYGTRAVASPTGRPATAAPAAKPMIAVLPRAAEAGHAVEEMLLRLKGYTLPRTLQWPKGCVGGKRVWWPGTLGTMEEEVLAAMRHSLWTQTSSRGGAPPADPTEFVTEWRDQEPGRLFHSELFRHFLDDTSARTLSAWSEFWSGLMPADGLAPMHLLLMKADWEECRAWLQRVVPASGTSLVLLPELGPCLRWHLDKWLDEDLVPFVPSVHRTFLNRMGITLRKEYLSDFLLRDMKARVHELVLEEFRAA